MPDDPNPPERRSIRMRRFDYGRIGSYFVTVCTDGRRCIFGDVVDGAMVLGPIGTIVTEEWHRTTDMRTELVPSPSVVMPNHAHMLVRIQRRPRPGGPEEILDDRRFGEGRGRRTLGSIIAGFKAAVTSRVRAASLLPEGDVWQRGYFEHVIRNERELRLVTEYIAENPRRWTLDHENPRCTPPPQAPDESDLTYWL